MGEKSLQKKTEILNPLTPKIWLLILPSSCYTFPCNLVTRIWCYIMKATSNWWVWVISLPACWTVYEFCKEKLHVNLGPKRVEVVDPPNGHCRHMTTCWMCTLGSCVCSTIQKYCIYVSDMFYNYASCNLS